MNFVSRGLLYLRTGLWQENLPSLPPARRFALGTLRVIVHVLRSFSHNLASLQAAGLTLLTMLALVPMLALVMAIAKGLGYADRFDEHLQRWQAQFPRDAAPAFEKLRELLTNVNFGAMGLIGSLILVWSAMTLFTRVEQSINRVWRTRRSRAWYRRISDFVALLVLVPPLNMLALLSTSMLDGVGLIVWLRQFELLDWFYKAGLGFVPYALASIAFTALYKIMPNAPVRWRSAAVGGLFSGILLITLHGIYMRLNVGVASANAVYLTFAALPILLVYLQLVWTIVLAGAEVAYAVQNLSSLHGSEQLPPAPRAVQQRLAWHLVAAACDGFRAGKRGVTAAELSMRMDVPMEWVDEVGDMLVRGGALVLLSGDNDRLMPALPPEQLDMAKVTSIVDGDEDGSLSRVRLPDELEQGIEAARRAACRQLEELRFGAPAATAQD